MVCQAVACCGADDGAVSGNCVIGHLLYVFHRADDAERVLLLELAPCDRARRGVRSADTPFFRHGLRVDGHTVRPGRRFHIDAEPQFLCGVHHDGRVECDCIPRAHIQGAEVNVLGKDQRAGVVVSVEAAALVHHGFESSGPISGVEPNTGEGFVVVVDKVGVTKTLHHAFAIS